MTYKHISANGMPVGGFLFFQPSSILWTYFLAPVSCFYIFFSLPPPHAPTTTEYTQVFKRAFMGDEINGIRKFKFMNKYGSGVHCAYLISFFLLNVGRKNELKNRRKYAPHTSFTFEQINEICVYECAFLCVRTLFTYYYPYSEEMKALNESEGKMVSKIRNRDNPGYVQT